MLLDELVVDEEEMDDDGGTIDDAIDWDEMDLAFLSLDSGCLVTIITDLCWFVWLSMLLLLLLLLELVEFDEDDDERDNKWVRLFTDSDFFTKFFTLPFLKNKNFSKN